MAENASECELHIRKILNLLIKNPSFWESQAGPGTRPDFKKNHSATLTYFDSNTDLLCKNILLNTQSIRTY